MKETNDIGSYQHFINERLFQFKNKDEYSNMKKIMNKEKLTDLLYDKKANLLQCQKIITLYFSTPMVFLSQLFSSKKIPVYLYNFCYKSSYPIKAPKTSTHTSELPFVFNTIKFDSKEDSMMQKKIENN
jgi:carboxylesterase type B